MNTKLYQGNYEVEEEFDSWQELIDDLLNYESQTMPSEQVEAITNSYILQLEYIEQIEREEDARIIPLADGRYLLLM